MQEAIEGMYASIMAAFPRVQIATQIALADRQLKQAALDKEDTFRAIRVAGHAVTSAQEAAHSDAEAEFAAARLHRTALYAQQAKLSTQALKDLDKSLQTAMRREFEDAETAAVKRSEEAAAHRDAVANTLAALMTKQAAELGVSVAELRQELGVNGGDTIVERMDKIAANLDVKVDGQAAILSAINSLREEVATLRMGSAPIEDEGTAGVRPFQPGGMAAHAPRE